jgi:hypothetical protein
MPVAGGLDGQGRAEAGDRVIQDKGTDLPVQHLGQGGGQGARLGEGLERSQVGFGEALVALAQEGGHDGLGRLDLALGPVEPVVAHPGGEVGIAGLA